MVALRLKLTVKQGRWQRGTRQLSLVDTSRRKAGSLPLSVLLWDKVRRSIRRTIIGQESKYQDKGCDSEADAYGPL